MIRPACSFGDALQETVERMLGETPLSVPTVTSSPTPASWSVTSKMSVSGRTSGWIRLRVEEDTARCIVRKALGFPELELCVSG